MGKITARTNGTQRGFTIVELLIVIVVIAILAAISIVAYTGIQQRGRDSARRSDLTSLQKAIEMYKIDNGKYPFCGATESSAYSSCRVSGLAPQLVPKYMSQIPLDPINTVNQEYWYARGYKKISQTGHTATASDQDYTVGIRLETAACGCSSAWGSQINLMVGNS